LLRLGSCFGKVTSHKAIINAETGLCKGYVQRRRGILARLTVLPCSYGFLMYSTTEEATWALAQIASYGLQTSWARVSGARVRTCRRMLILCIASQESFSSKLRRMADHDSANVYLSK